MKIVIIDVPAISGGALSILNMYYNKAIIDVDNQYIFIVSVPKLKSTKNISIKNYPWIKKSWLHRLYFDNLIAKKLIKEINPDSVISLQNIIVSNLEIKQTLYLHQPLPFSEIKFSFFINPRYWIYQNVISKFIFTSIIKADKVIVQTKWMKNKCLDYVDVNEGKIIVEQPQINYIDNKILYSPNNDSINFFYPTSSESYKNYTLLFESLRKIPVKYIDRYKLYITLSSSENRTIRKFHDILSREKIQVIFLGRISKEEVFKYYSKSILIFPSLIETFGLPLLEAKLQNCPIIAADLEYSKEILKDYNNVRYFNPLKPEELTKEILKKIGM